MIFREVPARLHRRLMRRTEQAVEENVETPPPSCQPSCPQGSVPINQLCDRCSRFFDTWELLDWCESQSHRERRRFENDFCTVAQLLQSQESCHMCKMIAHSLSGEPLKSRKIISFCDRYGSNWLEGPVGDHFRISVRVGDNGLRAPRLIARPYQRRFYSCHCRSWAN